MKITLKAITLPIVIGAFALLVPTAAQAASCGQIVKKDVTLTSDLDCSAGGSSGLIVGADDVTIDLAGYTIKGAGPQDGYSGIENEGKDLVTIKNGTIQGFREGLYLNNIAKNKMSGLKIRSGTAGIGVGIYSNYGTGNRFVNNTITNTNYGFQLLNGSQNTIADNRLVGANRGVFTTFESLDQVTDNVSEGFFSTTGYYSETDYRITYQGNVANDGYDGYLISNPRGIDIRGAQADENGHAGIWLDGAATCMTCSASVTRSVTNKNGEYGIYAAFPIKSRHNTALGNKYFNCIKAACNG